MTKGKFMHEEKEINTPIVFLFTTLFTWNGLFDQFEYYDTQKKNCVYCVILVYIFSNSSSAFVVRFSFVFLAPFYIPD